MNHPAYNICVVGLSLFFLMPQVQASIAGDVKQGNHAYQQGNYEHAAEIYEQALGKDPKSSAVEYNLGTALYKKKDYDNSIAHFQKALLSDDPSLVNKAQYNLGNAYYKKSEELEDSDVDAAIASLEKGIEYYDKALPRAKKDKDIKQNYAVFKEKLEKLKKKPKKPKGKKGEGQSDGKDGDSKDGKSDQTSESKDSKNNQPSKDNQQPNPNNDSTGNKNDNPQAPPNNGNGSDQQDQQKDQNKDGSGKGNSDQNKDSNKPDEQPGNSSGDGKKDSSDKSNSQGGNSVSDKGMMTPQEAQIFLDDYQRNEEPKGMIYFMPQTGKDKPVAKDW